MYRADANQGVLRGPLRSSNFRPRRILVAAMASVPVFTVSWATTLQQEIPADKLSRVSSYGAVGNYALAPAGTLVAGPLASALGIPVVLAAGGALIVVLPLLVLLVPEIRHMRRH